MHRAINWWVWLGDMLVLVGFAAIGRQSHAESNPLSAVLATAAPFVAAWSLVGYVASVWVPQPRLLWVVRTIVANGVACALALLIRASWLHRDSIPWTFALVSFGFTTLFLVIIRLLYRHTQETT
ncbi:MAG: DUF3054 domain-containing protein [Roseiflexaceae bacterium]|jgi:drug/metabolite transporter (DMT)-like permease|nr:DUF3054 domain-containing protein [Chloroflexaceae bacterium]